MEKNKINNDFKIVYIVYHELHFYPPCVSQIRLIKKLGYSIDVIYGDCDVTTIELLKKEGINCIQIKYNKPKSKVKKAFNIYNFRRNAKKVIKSYNSKRTIFWFGNAQSSVVMKGTMKKKRYVVSLLELHNDNRLLTKMLHGIIEKATKVTVCEETRGYIVKSMYNLDYLPTVFPNKSFKQIEKPRINPSDERTKKIIDSIYEDDVIIYQGYIMNTKELFELASALNETKKKYKLVLLGIDKWNVFEKIKKIYDNTVFFEYVPAPLHLEVTSYARIGIMFYEPKSLNYAFCAPNKIYEYSAFSIPMIGNDIPGLKNTMGLAHAGLCVKLDKENIKKAIEEIEDNYKYYSNNSRKFYDSCNSLQIMKDFIDEVINK